MAERLQDQVKKALADAEGLYYRLVLLVGKTGSGKTGVLRNFADDIDTEIININLMLSAELLELTTRQRAIRLPGILDQIVDQDQSTMVLDNIEILFDKNLKQDPLRLLQGISRNRSIVASWNGTTDGNKLIYAEAGHQEYRSYDLRDVTIVSMDVTATADSEKNTREAGQV